MYVSVVWAGGRGRINRSTNQANFYSILYFNSGCLAQIFLLALNRSHFFKDVFFLCDRILSSFLFLFFQSPKICTSNLFLFKCFPALPVCLVCLADSLSGWLCAAVKIINNFIQDAVFCYYASLGVSIEKSPKTHNQKKVVFAVTDMCCCTYVTLSVCDNFISWKLLIQRVADVNDFLLYISTFFLGTICLVLLWIGCDVFTVHIFISRVMSLVFS